LMRDHFTLPPDRDGLRLLVLKLNAHVAVTREGSEFQYGTMNRYKVTSPISASPLFTFA
jgi:hypothetical protein